ncbi:MAG TPA: NEAT domain-containing protein [Firmicutes bacterium]|nr:NEAT domain-containing protein [Bacillota bacterium]
MTTAKKPWRSRGLSLMLSLALLCSLFSIGAADAFAATLEPTTPIEKIDVPVEDGVYYADIDLWHATLNQSSMGNAALRGSTTFEANHPEDTDYRAIVVVKDNTATAIVEFMPMGFIGQYGFMMELEGVDAKYLTQFGAVFDTAGDPDAASYTAMDVLTRHLTQEGTTVYDSYNDPDSQYVYDGSTMRPPGYGHDEERPLDIEDVPYAHLIAIDVTPIWVQFEDSSKPAAAEDYTYENAAYVHVFVPVMYSIMPTSGDQYARMKVDWTSLEKIENPEENLQYCLWSAKQISGAAYTGESYEALQDAIREVTEEMEKIWPSSQIAMSGTGTSKQPILEQKEFTAEEQAAMVKKLSDAVDGLEEIGDKSNLNAVITQAETKAEADYTPNSWAAFQESLESAKTVQADQDAGVSQVNAAAQALTEAMEALVPRADTAGLAALVARAKEIEQGNYTEESWNALQQAIAAAEEALDNPNLSQKDISGQEIRLQNAVDGLAVKGALDKNNLEDGVYSVYGEMIKTNRTDKSMANDAISHTIKLTVEDGKYYLTMDFHGLAYLNKFGYLAELSYYDNGYTYGQYGAVEGNLVPATVLSTQKNADGTDVVDEFNQAGGSYAGKPYPDQVTFPLVSDALADEDGYVPLHVFVPVMEDISAGTGDQDVLLKLDWSTLRKTTEDDPAFEPEEPAEQSPAVDYTDAETGVAVHADKGVFDEGVQIVVSEITAGADYEAAASSLSGMGQGFRLYDVQFLDADGNAVTPNGTVSIRFPVAAGYDSVDWTVYRLADGGKVLVRGAAEDGYYTVVTRTAGLYALVYPANAGTDAEDPGNAGEGSTQAPMTGERSKAGAFALLALAAAGTIGAAASVKKRKAKNS